MPLNKKGLTACLAVACLLTIFAANLIYVNNYSNAASPNQTSTDLTTPETAPAILLQDDFDDNSFNDDLWEKLEVHGGTVEETNGTLQVTVPSNPGVGSVHNWSQAGYVTKNAYDSHAFYGSNQQGYEVSVDVKSLNEVSEMLLLLGEQKETNLDPSNTSNNWIRILKNKESWSPNQHTLMVQSCLNGTVSLKAQIPWVSATGELKIKVSSGSMAFYENGIMRYAEPYPFASDKCYVYVYASSPGYFSGTDSFDNFRITSPEMFRDEFGHDLTFIRENWTAHNEMELALAYINTPFLVNRHVRVDMQTLSSQNTDISDVTWLVVKDHDKDNRVYAFIGTNGTVELSVIYGGSKTSWQTPSNLDPYIKHSMAVSVIGNNVKVWVDGQLYIDKTSEYLSCLAGYAGVASSRSNATFGAIAVFT